MRLSIPDDFDDLRNLPRERTPEPRRPTESMPEPGPLDRRLERLHEQAEQKNFPEIPRRHYESKVSPEPPLDRDPGDRHVRSRTSLPHSPLLPVRLHPEEKLLLADAGRFRVVSLKDLAETIYGGNERAARSDLRYLQRQALVTLDIVNARRDGRRRPVQRFEVISLTQAGEHVARLTNPIEPGQRLYHGLVKPREVEHDSQIYRAYRKEAEKIRAQGGERLRVRLDFELKAEVQKAIYAARKTDPSQTMDEIKQAVAEQYQLPFVDHQIQIPDARIEYDLD